MGQKPNYNFERKERDRRKAEKKGCKGEGKSRKNRTSQDRYKARD